MLGLGVVFMHYLGMYGLKFNGFIEWDWGRVALSVLIAIVAATAALWLAFKTPTLPIRAAAAIIMAVAVCAMHYTGMGRRSLSAPQPTSRPFRKVRATSVPSSWAAGSR